MPKQGRRWTLYASACGPAWEGPDLERGGERVDVIEVAALEGLARHFDNKDQYAQDCADEIGFGDEQQAELGERDAFKTAAKEVRNLIEQGGAAESTELHLAEQLQEDIELGGGSE